MRCAQHESLIGNNDSSTLRIEAEIIHLGEVGSCGLWIVGRKQIRRQAPWTISLDDAVDGDIPDSKLCNIHLDFSFYLLRTNSALRAPVELPSDISDHRRVERTHAGTALGLQFPCRERAASQSTDRGAARGSQPR